jgi:hypothetical protein
MTVFCGRALGRSDPGVCTVGTNTAFHRGCDMAVTIGHLFGICSCTGWDDIYERGQKLVRRDNEGLLKPIESETTAWPKPSPFSARRSPNKLVDNASGRRFPAGPPAAGTVAQQARSRRKQQSARKFCLRVSAISRRPGEVFLQLVTQSAARAQRYASELEALVDEEGLAAAMVGEIEIPTKHGGYKAGEYIRGLAQLEAQERDRCANFATKAVAAGLAERQVRLAE